MGRSDCIIVWCWVWVGIGRTDCWESGVGVSDVWTRIRISFCVWINESSAGWVCGCVRCVRCGGRELCR